MDHAVSLRELRAARNIRNAAALLVFVLVGVVGYQAAALRDQKSVVVLVPTVVPEGTVAHGAKVSASYLEGLARDAVYSLLNVTPETTSYARDTLARMAAPHARVEILDFWEDVMNEVRTRRISTAFYPSILETSPGGLSVIVDGELSTYLGTSRVGRERKRYEIGFAYVNSTARISKIIELEPPS